MSSFIWLLSLPGPRTVGDLLVGGQALCTNGLKGGFQFGICQHMCPCGRTSFPKYLLPPCVCVCPQGQSSSSLLPLEVLQDQSKWRSRRFLSNYYLCFGSQSMSFNTCSCPILRPCWPSKQDILGAHLLGVGSPDWGYCFVAQTPNSLGGYVHLLVTYPGLWVLTIPHLCPYYHCCFFLISVYLYLYLSI